MVRNRFILIFSLRLNVDYLFIDLDPRFPSDHKVTLYFGNNTPNGDGRGYIFQSPLVKIEPVTTLAKYDSLEDFDDGK